MSDALKPCPFCGSGRVTEIGFDFVECSDCRCRSMTVAAWNTRATPDPALFREMVENLNAAYERLIDWTTLEEVGFDQNRLIEELVRERASRLELGREIRAVLDKIGGE